MKSPIRKLLVSVNYLNSNNLICLYSKLFHSIKKENINTKMSMRLRSQALSFPSFISKENQVFNRENNPSQKISLVEEDR